MPASVPPDIALDRPALGGTDEELDAVHALVAQVRAARAILAPDLDTSDTTIDALASEALHLAWLSTRPTTASEWGTHDDLLAFLQRASWTPYFPTDDDIPAAALTAVHALVDRKLDAVAHALRERERTVPSAGVVGAARALIALYDDPILCGPGPRFAAAIEALRRAVDGTDR